MFILHKCQHKDSNKNIIYLCPLQVKIGLNDESRSELDQGKCLFYKHFEILVFLNLNQWKNKNEDPETLTPRFALSIINVFSTTYFFYLFGKKRPLSFLREIDNWEIQLCGVFAWWAILCIGCDKQTKAT